MEQFKKKRNKTDVGVGQLFNVRCRLVPQHNLRLALSLRIILMSETPKLRKTVILLTHIKISTISTPVL